MRNIQTIAALAGLLAAPLVPSAVQAQETLYIAGPGGGKQEAIEKVLFPIFEAKTGAKVVYVPGGSSATLAKLIAQKGNQDLSLVIMDSSVMRQAVQQELCAPLPNLPVLNDLYPEARMKGDRSIGDGFYAVGLVYNTKVFEENGWEAPTSWNDLGDPKYRGKVAIGPISGYGIEALVMVAKANGGSEINIEPGFEVFSEKIAPNVFAWENNNANLAQMLQTGEAALSVWNNTRAGILMDQGAPVEFVIPKEGGEMAMSSECVVNGAPQPELAARFLEIALSPEGQIAVANSSGYGPVNNKVDLEPELAAKVVGPDQLKKLVPTAWDVVNEQRDKWTQRWNREVER
ncbi:ABC transporter substrate-binding protein (plasmid) [Sinorhizobium meliloti]